ncbi:MAG: family 16 glycoside hydrolase [Verrucomicrobiota bacterium]
MRHSRTLAVVSLISLAHVHAEDAWKSLWNGRDLSEWSTWLDRPDPASEVPCLPKGPDGRYQEAVGSGRDPLRVFTVVEVDGQKAIRISGEVFGELRSHESLQNYRLRLQFKWGNLKWAPRNRPETPRDSGLLYHVHSAPGAEGRTWARSIELQIQERDVGDLYAIGAEISVKSTARKDGERKIFDYDPQGEFHVFSQVPGQDGRCVKQPDNEKPNGEWNSVEIVCYGDDILHLVNGKVVMRLHGPRQIDQPDRPPVTAGPIILQSEGAEIFYRNVEYRPITALPPELVTAPAETPAAEDAPPVMGSKIFDWAQLPVRSSARGELRQVCRAATATLDELECHVTTLKVGEQAHPPHQHPDEELIIVKEGTVESLVNGELKTVGPGSVIFQAANQPHSIRNAGDTPAIYHVIKWNSPGMLKKKP